VPSLHGHLPFTRVDDPLSAPRPILPLCFNRDSQGTRWRWERGGDVAKEEEEEEEEEEELVVVVERLYLRRVT
jgi:hypothetical protein